jgi:hypothetical protein
MKEQLGKNSFNQTTSAASLAVNGVDAITR